MIKKHGKLLAYMLALAVFTTYVVMDTFVISRVYGEASGSGNETAMQIESNGGNAGQTDDAAAEDTDDNSTSGNAANGSAK